MPEYALLIFGIGLVVYNGAKVLMTAVDWFSNFMASHDAELMASLDENKDDGAG